MENRQHITLACSRLDLPGGVERSVVNIANLLHTNGHPVTILIMDKTADSFYALREGIHVIQKNLHLGIGRNGNMLARKWALLKHIKTLRDIVKTIKPDVIISTDYSITIAVWMAAYRLNVKITSREAHHFYWLGKNRFWQYLFTCIYPKLDRVVCLNKTEEKLFKAIGCNTVVIPNFITNRTKPTTAKNKQLLTIGWLIKRKGVDLIPEIARIVLSKNKDWKWIIIGKGDEYENLQKRIDAAGLKQHVQVQSPAVPDLSGYYSKTAIYVMTSRFEAFPNVLIEAMSFGIPCVAFNCLSGPSDIITNGVDGFLIEPENTEGAAQAINDLIADEGKRNSMGKKAFQNIQRLSPDSIYLLWKDLFDTVTKIG